jgi:hypothetical protein
VHLSQEVVQGICGVLVEVTRGLVRKEQRRLHDEGARNRNALLLPTRQHARTMIEARLETHATKQP